MPRRVEVNLRVPLGQVVWTRAVNDRVAGDIRFAEFVADSLARHRKGEWGELSKEDREANDLALKDSSRLLSAYEVDGLPKIWIITEADRSATTILFPDEY